MKPNYETISRPTNRFTTVIEVLNYEAWNAVINFPRISTAEFLRPEDRKKEEFIKGYWKLKSVK